MEHVRNLPNGIGAQGKPDECIHQDVVSTRNRPHTGHDQVTGCARRNPAPASGRNHQEEIDPKCIGQALGVQEQQEQGDCAYDADVSDHHAPTWEFGFQVVGQDASQRNAQEPAGGCA